MPGIRPNADFAEELIAFCRQHSEITEPRLMLAPSSVFLQALDMPAARPHQRKIAVPRDIPHRLPFSRRRAIATTPAVLSWLS
jgi:hypothetical protein